MFFKFIYFLTFDMHVLISNANKRLTKLAVTAKWVLLCFCKVYEVQISFM